MEISVKDIESLARNRKLHMAFETAWELRTGMNPVIIATESVNCERRKANRRNYLVRDGALCITCILALSAILYHGSLLTNQITLQTILDSSIISILITVLLVAGTVFLAERDMQIPEIKTDEAVAFGRDLQVFFRQEPIDKWGCSARVTTEELREYAMETLVQTARKVLDAKNPEKADEEPQHVLIRQGELMGEFKRQYDALSRIGMISGGYDKIFRKASAILAKSVKS